MAKFPQRLEGWPYKVLIICRRGLSDIIWALPLITAIKSLFPTAKIDWMIDDKYADFISCVKGVDDKVIYPRGDVWPLLKPFKPLFRPLVQALQIVRSFIAKLRDRLYPASFDVEATIAARLLTYLASIRLRVGRKKSFGLHSLNNYAVPVELFSEGHAIDRNIALLYGWAKDLKLKPEPPEIILPEETLKRRDEFLEKIKIEKRRYVVMHPGAPYPSRQWSGDGYAELAKSLYENYGYKSVLTWGVGEKGCAWEVVDKAGLENAFLAPDCDLLLLTAIIKEAVLCVAPDTGPLHLASALKIPTVGLYGTTDPAERRPYWGCSRVVSRYPDAKNWAEKKLALDVCPIMQEIPSEEVFAAAAAALEEAAKTGNNL